MSSILAGAKKMRVLDVAIVIAIIAAVILAVRMLVLYKGGSAQFDGFDGLSKDTTASATATAPTGVHPIEVQNVKTIDEIHAKKTDAVPHTIDTFASRGSGRKRK
jgi:hypothetical protein